MAVGTRRLKSIGRRIELVAMDTHCQDITLGLYEQTADDGARFLVHSYSSREGAAERTRFVARAMAVMGGMEIDRDHDTMLRFPCGRPHRVACRRIFLESAKFATGASLEARPLEIFDKRKKKTIYVTSLGEGEYLTRTAGEVGLQDRRAAVAVLGLVKLGDMEAVPDTSDRVRFRCDTSHDAAVGMLLTRALEVRAALREIENRAARGVLAAAGVGVDVLLEYHFDEETGQFGGDPDIVWHQDPPPGTPIEPGDSATIRVEPAPCPSLKHPASRLTHLRPRLRPTPDSRRGTGGSSEGGWPRHSLSAASLSGHGPSLHGPAARTRPGSTIGTSRPVPRSAVGEPAP